MKFEFVLMNLYTIVSFRRNDSSSDKVSSLAAVATGVGAGTGTATQAASDVFIIDPSYLALSYLKGYRTEDLAKTGLAENKQMSVDWTLICNTELSHAFIGDISSTAAMTA